MTKQPGNPPMPQPGGDPPLDTAQQSLGDALRTSFRILKFAMLVLVVLFFASGAFIVEQNEQAVVLRLGHPVNGVRDPGAYWAFPYPIDKVIKLPVRQSSTMAVDSHWFAMRESEKNLSLDQIQRGLTGLHPMRDGALLTGDKGLVHVMWQITYRISDLAKFVQTVADEDIAKAETVITRVLENAAIEVAGGFTTEDVTRKRLTDLRELVKVQINSILTDLNTGIAVDRVEIPMSTPPIQTRSAFANVIRAENNKQSTITQARQQASELLNITAGASYRRVIELLDQRDDAHESGDRLQYETLTTQVDRVLESEASGRVGSMIREAKGYYTAVVQNMRGDAEQFETLLQEYRQRPDVLKARLWQQTKERLLGSEEITKIYRPVGAQFRIQVGPDPHLRERKERRRYLEQQQDPKRHRHEGPLREMTPGGKVG